MPPVAPPAPHQSAAEVASSALPITMHGAIDHAHPSIHGYRLFVNPSTSEELCTATAEALAMGKTVVLPRDAMVAEYRRRRDFVVAALDAIEGVSCPTPEGAFYAFPDVSSFGMTSREIADGLLYDAGVAVLPGTDFGANGEGKIRLSYVGEMATLEEGARRIKAYFDRLRKKAATGS